MFDIGWTEIVVIIIICCLMLDIKDIANIIKLAKQFFIQFNNFIKEAKVFIADIEEETQVVTRKITDLEGKEQTAYDLEKIMPEVYKSKKIKQDEKQ